MGIIRQKGQSVFEAIQCAVKRGKLGNLDLTEADSEELQREAVEFSSFAEFVKGERRPGESMTDTCVRLGATIDVLPP